MNFLKRFGVISKLKTREKLKEIRVEKFHVSNRSVHSSSNKSKRFDTPCFRSKKTRNSIKRAVCISHGLSPRPKPHHPSSENEKGKKKKTRRESIVCIYTAWKKSFSDRFFIEFPHPHISIPNKTFFSRGRSWTFGHSNRYRRGNS